jgi:hypothetical protein
MGDVRAPPSNWNGVNLSPPTGAKPVGGELGDERVHALTSNKVMHRSRLRRPGDP